MNLTASKIDNAFAAAGQMFLSIAPVREFTAPEPKDATTAWLLAFRDRLIAARQREALNTSMGFEAQVCATLKSYDEQIAEIEARLAPQATTLCRQCNDWTNDSKGICSVCRAEGFVHVSEVEEEEDEPQDGEITRPGVRFCASCDREHGAGFLCPSYSPSIVGAVMAYDGEPLQEGQAGDGISSLLATMTRRSSR